MNLQEAIAQFQADKARLMDLGVSWHDEVEPKSYMPDDFRRDYSLAMDAQPSLLTAASGGIPVLFTTMVDPQVYRVLFSPNKAAIIYTERRKGTWVDDVALFPIVETVGEVTSYGDYNPNGHTGVNANWPQRQSYLFQTIKEYGEREIERAGLAKLNWVAEIDTAAAVVLQKFQNLTYFFGVQGLQNYGTLNDPSLTASLTPAPKAFGNSRWVTNGVVTATANEIYTDIQTMFSQLVTQSGGLIEAEDRLVLAMSPGAAVALTATNSFNVSVKDLLKKNFPNIRFETAIQYGALSTSNPQGVAAGNFVQLFAESVEGQETVYAAYNEKMRNHPVIRHMSSFRQKVTAGTWGAIIRAPFAIANMVGV